ncbi:hypothetical protein, variant [Exophiala xenobiotica]|uniref:Transcription factor domain-containing protein n=1 Tax=Exophiala xenobiotica TaxID=348802 RepID=A0A0D2CYD0_9EURO|nr:hypothetical protein, variant [Exophiala xenobiotica]XP_013315741.1 uncharacterized protein PV05_07461 [Exophiala xenobiotica]KIW55156.1 hypothetical protein PV05_07461 [Exophiala xenobiotica]KIW55157.1 hypothetical protein, variant [Exophiala xenobiotica]
MEAPEDCEIDSITAGWEDFPMEHFVADTVLCDMYPTCPDGAETRFEPSDNFDLCLGLSDDSLDLFSEVVQPQTPSAPTYETPYLNYSPVSVSFTYGADLGDIDAATIRLLLDCYQQKLVPALTPAQVYPKSPWQILHIPKVHETLGEVLVRGDAGNPRVALFFAVLSAAAYHVDALGPEESKEDSTIPWKVLGQRFRCRAKERLKSSFRSLSSKGQMEDYTDMLLALLSMVTVCVVSGDMLEIYAYLRDIERLIVHHGLDRIHMSKSIRMLHSTFLYLTTLQGSIRIFSENGRSEMHAPLLLDSRQEAGAMFTLDQDGSIWAKLLQSRTDLNGTDVNKNDLRQTGNGIHDHGEWTPSMFEQIYSIPETLFRLIGRATKLAGLVDQGEGQRETSVLATSNPTSKLITALETDICGWKNDIPRPGSITRPNDNQTPFPQDRSSKASSALLYHFREAVHSALMIYFYRCVRIVDTYTVQPFVERTMEHIQVYAGERLKSGYHSSSTIWPVFVAACEALNDEARQKMSAWFTQEAAQTGLRSFQMAGQAVKDVWDARDRSGNRNLPWAHILKHNNTLDKLMPS